MNRYVVDLKEIDQTQIAVVGGKAAHLGELSRIDGVSVPDGFCVTTDAFLLTLGEAPSIEDRFERLSYLGPSDANAIRAYGGQLRRTIEGLIIPDEVEAAITAALARFGDQEAYAVRSSATAEDLPTASFAGQQDTFLNVVGKPAILDGISRCWASLFTERAVIYRMRNGFDHRKVRMGVVVQRMVFPEAAGILFTADPVSGHRKVSSIDASFGLGEALVAGLVNPDVYTVRDGVIVQKTIGTKKIAIQAAAEGGTQESPIEPDRQRQLVLSDTQILRLEALGRQIEAHFGRPQDIEWCMVGDKFEIVQSRPITTLFPVPEVTDGENHLYLSVGHQQMMTDAFKPLGLSFWQMETPRPMAEAGGRLFVDIAGMLSTVAGRANMLDMMGKSDPLFRDAIETVLSRENFIRLVTNETNLTAAAIATPGAIQPPAARPLEVNSAIVTTLIQQNEASVAKLKRDIQEKSGTELLDFILADIQELRRILFNPDSNRVFMTAFESTWWLNEKMQLWLGEKNAADAITQSVDNNITSEMGLELLDVADVIRPHSEVVAFLERAQGSDQTSQKLLDQLGERAGGDSAREAIRGWLDKYGMRGVGEIDITRPRWAESLDTLLPLLIGNIRNAEPGAAKRRFDQGLEHARRKERDLLERLRILPDGERKAEEAKLHIDRIRTFIGYREYPKYGKTCRDFVYKLALMGEAGRLVAAGVIREKEDIFYLCFQELQEVVRTNQLDEQLLRQRKEEFKTFQSLRPPRVMTSEGESINGSYRRDNVSPGALVGLGVSAGSVEGRARVILDMGKADLEPSDILVTAYTDPSWTPLFVAIKGLVTEVGGMMTHGAVIAREYGLPAVVGVENATRLIRDGQRIRVDGSEGLVEILG